MSDTAAAGNTRLSSICRGLRGRQFWRLVRRGLDLRCNPAVRVWPACGTRAKIITHRSHVVEQYADAMVIGEARPHPDAIFPCDPVAEQFVKRLRELNLHDFVILNPGAGWGAKQWPAERYGAVARRWRAREFHHSLILDRAKTAGQNCGAAVAELRELFVHFLDRRVGHAQRARLFIGGDTRPMHMAATLQVPVVWRFSPRSRTQRPLRTRRRRAAWPSDQRCGPTPDRTRPRFDGHHHQQSRSTLP